jgi:hypothetical protein
VIGRLRALRNTPSITRYHVGSFPNVSSVTQPYYIKSMDACEFAPALLLVHLMHSFISEQQSKRTLALADADVASCSATCGIFEADSFLFSSNNTKFCCPQEVLDAAVAYLARPSPGLILQPPPHPTPLPTSDDSMSPILLIIMGADSLPLVQDAVSAFIGSWHAAGCRRIVITGGIGRATPDLIKSFNKSAVKVKAALDNSSIIHVSLPFAHALGGPQALPFLHDYSSFSVSWHPAIVAQ